MLFGPRFLAVFLLANLSMSSSAQEADISAYLLSLQSEPFVIRDGLDSFKLLIEVIDTSITAISFEGSSRLAHKGAFDTPFSLNDEGIDGDDTAGDLVFTVGELSTTRQAFSFTDEAYTSGLFSELNFEIVLSDGTREAFGVGTARIPFGISIIDAVQLPAPDIYLIEGSDAQFSDYVFNPVYTDIFDDFPFLLITDTTENIGPAYTKDFYAYFEDDRDFITVFHLMGTHPTGGGTYGNVKNDSEGIGRALFDLSTLYGSQDILQGIISIFPSNFVMSTLTHEVLHRWARYWDFSFITDARGGHWAPWMERASTGFNANLASGGSNCLSIELESPGQYRCWVRRDGVSNGGGMFNDFELYLMGLIGADDITGPVRFPVNPERLDFVQDGDDIYSLIKADSLASLHIEDVIAKHGVRTPLPGISQSAFAMGVIVPSLRPLTPVEMTFFDAFIRDYEQRQTVNYQQSLVPFSIAAGGLATMTTKLNLRPDVGFSHVSNQKPQKDLSRTIAFETYPNPFSTRTSIAFDLIHPSFVLLEAYDVLGRRVATIASRVFPRGKNNTHWDASHLPNGLYFVRLIADQQIVTQKLVLQR